MAPAIQPAVSVGIVDGEPRLDLHYDDDVRADTDMNVVMTGAGGFVELQGTAEGEAFTLYSPDEMHHLQQIEQLLGRPIERRKLEDFRYYSEPQLTPGGPKAAAATQPMDRSG